MIRFSLRCADGHSFDSWFQSSAAFDSLSAAGRLTCAVCGGAQVDKAPMAPSVVTEHASARPERPLSMPTSPTEAALAALRRHIEENSDYVGMNFAAEARKMHAGEVPERSIHGEARPDEARRLIEDGVPVAPLPFLPAGKVN
ncbi:MAG: DUF1178 family protein [Paracoccaceae bacterium]|nr:MAG: DUF1178 family protein [Paracoccaceae bacterium]